jgi:hypothetical protein
MLRKDYDRKGSDAKRKRKRNGSESQAAWHQDELISVKKDLL